MTPVHLSDVSPGLAAAMAHWARRRDDALCDWHLLIEPLQSNAPVLAACGMSLPEDLERRDDDVIGNRCAACQWFALRSA